MSARTAGLSDVRERILAFFRRVNAEPSGLAAGATVLAICAAASWLFWRPLGTPSEVANRIVPGGNCIGLQPGSVLMYLCSMKVAGIVVIAPIALMVIMFVLRKSITAGVVRIRERIPQETRFLVPPLLATVIFGISWAGVHASTGQVSGFVPQTVFPAVVGIFTFAVARWGPAIQRALAPAFDLRDRVSMKVRIGAAVAIPFAISFAITAEQRVSNTAFKEQLVVIVGLVTGFVVLAPRQGDLLSGVAQAVGKIGEAAGSLRARR